VRPVQRRWNRHFAALPHPHSGHGFVDSGNYLISAKQEFNRTILVATAKNLFAVDTEDLVNQNRLPGLRDSTGFLVE